MGGQCRRGNPHERWRLKVYLASGWFTEEQKRMMDKVRNCLLDCNLEVFAPYYDALMDESQSREIFECDTGKIRWADFIVAVINVFDPGTIWEWGYAYGIGKPVIAYYEGPEMKLSPMLEQSYTSLAVGIEQLREEINGIRTK